MRRLSYPWQARSKPYNSSTRLVPVLHLCRQNLLLHYDHRHSTSDISKILTFNFSKHPIASCHSPPIVAAYHPFVRSPRVLIDTDRFSL